MKRKINPASIADFNQALSLRNPALNKAINRHFQGTITGVKALSANASWPFLCNIQRTEGPDNNDYICAIPGYIPRIGDLVECEWRDAHPTSGYIKYPLSTLTTAGVGVLPNGLAKIIANVAALGNNAAVTGLSITVIIVAGRRIKVTLKAELIKHTAAALALNLMQDGVQVDQWLQNVTADASTSTGIAIAYLQPSAGSHIYSAQVGVSNGTVDVQAGLTNPAYIVAEDIGI